MAKEYKNFQMEIYIKVHIKMENPQVLDNIIGLMAVILKEILKMV